MDIVVVRLQSHGHRFELPCHRHRMEVYIRSGRQQPPETISGIVAHPSVFTNCHRKELATNANLQIAFQTTSYDKICPVILQFGDVLVNDKDRSEKKHARTEHYEQSVQIILSMLKNKFTGEAPEDHELREEMKAIKESRIVEGRDLLLHCAAVAAIVVRRGKIDCKRQLVKAVVKYPIREDSKIDAMWNELLVAFDGLVVSTTRKLIQVGSETSASETPEDNDNNQAAAAVTKSPTKKYVQLELLVDRYVILHPFTEWTAVCQMSDVQMSEPTDKDIDFFNTYEFSTSDEVTTIADVDLANRLQAVEQGKSKSNTSGGGDAVVTGTPTKGGKKKGKSRDDDSLDDEERPAVKVPDFVSKYDVMTHKQLQDLCRKNLLSTGGKKQDLVERLEAFDEAQKPRPGKK